MLLREAPGAGVATYFKNIYLFAKTTAGWFEISMIYTLFLSQQFQSL